MSVKMKSLQSEINKLKYENENIKNALNQILTEYADYRQECDEICKEYEETIQLLSDSLEKFKSENSKLNLENNSLYCEKEKMKIDQEKLSKELEKAREKNKDKIKDIEILNNKLDQLQAQFNSINKKETNLKSKVVTLETDNDHYLNKIHQYEEEVTDLKDNLENTIESLITTQNDFEEYKNKKEEELERLKLKLQEEKDNVRALMNKKVIIKHNKIQNNFSNNNKNDEFNLDEDEIKKEEEEEKNKKVERKLSWNENEKVPLRGRYIRVENKTNTEINKIQNNKNDVEKEQEYMMEMGVGRNNRAMTMFTNSCNFGELLSKLRKRKEELVRLNKKIKKDTAILKKK